MLDLDSRAVVARLDGAVATSGLSMRGFAQALGTSASRFSSYRSGKVSPSAVFLLRAERIAGALAEARRVNVPSSLDAAESVLRAVGDGNDDWAYALALEARDRLRDILSRQQSLARAWEAQPSSKLDHPWKALLAAFVSHEFFEAGLQAPRWTTVAKLEAAWVLDSPRLTPNEIRRQTPAWLAERNIYIAAKDLTTL